MSIRISFRVDRELPASLSISPAVKQNVAVDLFDSDRLDDVLSALNHLGAVVISAIGVRGDFEFLKSWDHLDPDWVAAVVGSDNHEWLADDSYVWPYDRSKQRVPPEQALKSV